MVGDGEENDGDGGELDTPGLPADSHGEICCSTSPVLPGWLAD